MEKVEKAPIFLITTFYLPWELWDNEKEPSEEHEPKRWESFLYKRKRTWGFYHDYETAEKCILENWTDLYEDGYYNMAVIEKRGEGILEMCEEIWFRVNPIINEEAIREREERKKAWEEARYFGKALGVYIKRRADELEQYFGPFVLPKFIDDYEVSSEIDAGLISKIMMGKASPAIFKGEQWGQLLRLLEVTPEETDELNALMVAALEDPEFHGVPEALRNPIIAHSRSSATSGPSTNAGWMVKGYEIEKVGKPERLKNYSGWAIG